MLLLPKSYFLSCPGITSLPYGQVSSESPLPSPPSTLQSKCRLCSSQGVALLSGIPAAPPVHLTRWRTSQPCLLQEVGEVHSQFNSPIPSPILGSPEATGREGKFPPLSTCLPPEKVLGGSRRQPEYTLSCSLYLKFQGPRLIPSITT